MDRDKLGKFISVQRKNKGFTQQKLAEELNISNKTISKWETGEGYPDITIVPRLAEVLEVTPNELLSCERRNNAEGTFLTRPSIVPSHYFTVR